MTGRRGRWRKQLLDDLKDRRRYCKLKEEALDRALCRTRFGKGIEHVIRQTRGWMDGWMNEWIYRTLSRKHKFSEEQLSDGRTLLTGGNEFIHGTSILVGQIELNSVYTLISNKYQWTFMSSVEILAVEAMLY